MSTFLDLGLDCCAVSLQYLTFKELQSVRLASKSLFAAADAETLWHLKCKQAGICGVKPTTTWRQFSKRISLPKMMSEVDPVKGQFKGDLRTIVSFDVDPLEDADEIAEGEQRKLLKETDSDFINSSKVFANCGSLTVEKSSRVLGLISSSPSAATHDFIRLQVCHHLNVLPGLKGTLCSANSRSFDHQVAIETMDVFPTDGESHPLVVLHLYAKDVAADSKLVAKLVKSMFHVCSSITLVGEHVNDVVEWQKHISPHFRDDSAMTLGLSAFSTAATVPDFNCAILSQEHHHQFANAFELLNSLPAECEEWKHFLDCRAALPSSSSVQSSRSSSRSASAAPEIHPPQQHEYEEEEEFFTPSSPQLHKIKPFRIPAWIDPLVTAPIPPSAILQMLDIAVTDAPVNCWSMPVMTSMVASTVTDCHMFYFAAMSTEIEDLCRPLDSDALKVQHAMANVDIVSMHDHFFYAALRKYNMQLEGICGTHTEASLQLMELLKRDISNSFRIMYRANHRVSREYSQAVFDQVFGPLRSHFFGQDGDGFNCKKGLTHWFSSMKDKISEFELKAEGPKRYDILAEQVKDKIVPEILQFCDDHPDHPFVKKSDVQLATSELVAMCNNLLAKFTKVDSDALGAMQRNSAIYTSYVGSEWAAAAMGAAANGLRSQRKSAETFCALKQKQLLGERNRSQAAALTAHDAIVLQCSKRQDEINNCVMEERRLQESVVRLSAMLNKDENLMKDCNVVDGKSSASASGGAPGGFFQKMKQKLMSKKV